ncbi:MAG TPA: hypothetical protein VMX57_02955 [Planctomycetota bacterium]|nr:hypothetical protein [Planctomycetota bacterium]
MGFDRVFKVLLLVLIALAIAAFYDSVGCNGRYIYHGQSAFDTRTGEMFEVVRGKDDRNEWRRVVPPIP